MVRTHESVNVNMNIGKALYTTLLEEDFAGGVPPAGWTTDAPLHWMGSSTNYAGGTVPEAEFYYLNSDVGDFHLYTGVIDTTGFTALGLKFKEMVNDYNGDYTLKVQTSTDGGVTWSDAYVRPGGPYGPATTEITLTAANGVGSATFQISWTYSGNAFNINYWYIDDVWMGIIDMVDEYDQTVTVDIAAGASMNVTLPDWTPSDIPFANSIDYLVNVEATLNGFSPIYNYGFEDWVPPSGTMWPYGWTQTDTGWVEYSSNPTGGTGNCAEISYYSCSDGEWFMSPAVDTTSLSALTLSFKTFIDWYGDSDTNFWVETRANSGDTWTDRTPWANPMTGNYLWSGNIDITDDIGTGTQVRFVFTGYNFDFDYWYIDDVIIGPTTWDFTPAIIPGYWPSWTLYNYGTTTDQWFGVTSGSYPTCSPPEGIYMAEYNSFNILTGNSAELDGTVLVDFTAATQMKFKMMHDTGYAGSADVVYPLLSADGVNFWYDGTAYYRYDGTTGWKTETMDYSYLINYLGGPGNYYVGFYAISAYGNNIFIDDLSVSIASDDPRWIPSRQHLRCNHHPQLRTRCWSHCNHARPSGSAPAKD